MAASKKKTTKKKYPKTVVAVLEAAQKLIADRKKWTVRASGRDKNGRSVSPRSREAVRFCAVGAMTRVNGSLHWPAEARLQKWSEILFGRGIIGVNDSKGNGHGHKGVMRVFRCAIADKEVV